ncbi:uncharacterized protein [Typha latifolia]|uniref:uncharacterized protein n=1 Tax=Typha latifolia TaxID=4733 RepID=UPI003C2CDC67
MVYFFTSTVQCTQLYLLIRSIPIILTIPKNCSYYHHSMMTVGRICPYRLVVQDISLSRRQRGFDFPWG